MIYSRKDWMKFYKKNLYNLAKSYESMGEDIHVTTKSTKAEIVDALIEYFEKKNLPKEAPEMSKSGEMRCK